MDDYAGRVLAGRYRLPAVPADEYEPADTSAFDTYSGQEVLVRQLPLPEIVHAQFDGGGPAADPDGHTDDTAREALAAARAAAAVPDHPRLVQVFDVLIEDGSLWVVSELVPGARPMDALIAEAPLSPYRAAEIAADLLTGLRALHASGWTHRNLTVGTVLVCDDGRAMLDGLAYGAAQEALCGYHPVPQEAMAASGAATAAGEAGWTEPMSPLALERARQARVTVVGAVTERWAPEQAAGPVPGNWQLAPPVGPAADLWALGAFLFRCVQGHPAFPEESAAELVRLVCAEPAAYAEECGPLRPVVESLMRPDPAERPEIEELRGWLRSLVRSAPEPDVGSNTVAVPTAPADPRRLPIVRRKGELVRSRRKRERAERAAAKAAYAAEAAARSTVARRAAAPPAMVPPQAMGTFGPPLSTVPATTAHGRHAHRARAGALPAGRREGAPAALGLPPAASPWDVPPTAARPPAGRGGGPKRLGLLLVGLVFAALVAALVYAVLNGQRHHGAVHPRPSQGSAGAHRTTGPTGPPSSSPTTAGSATAPATPAATLAAGFTLRHDPAGFTVAVHDGWGRTTGPNGETVFSSGGDALRLVVVRGRDAAGTSGGDPIGYETQHEPELAAFRASTWSSSSDLRNVESDGYPGAEGQFSWRDPHSGAQMYGLNLAVLRNGHFDVVLLTGPDDQRSLVASYFAQSADTFRAQR